MNRVTTQTLDPVSVGQLLGIGRNTAYKLIRKGVIPSLRLGKKIRVPKAALDELLRNPQRVQEVTQ